MPDSLRDIILDFREARAVDRRPSPHERDARAGQGHRLHRSAPRRQVDVPVPAGAEAARPRRAARQRPLPELLRRPPPSSAARGARRRGGRLLRPASGKEEHRDGLLLLRRDPGRARLGAVRRPPDADGEVRGVHHGIVGADAVAGDRDPDARPGRCRGRSSLLVPGVSRLQGHRRRRPPVDAPAPAGAQGLRGVLGTGRVSGGRGDSIARCASGSTRSTGARCCFATWWSGTTSRIPVRYRTWLTDWSTTSRRCIPSTG